MINRIYRSLFVYTTGFYELIRENIGEFWEELDVIVFYLAHSKHKFSTVTSILKVFTILLEYASRSDYKTILTAISSEHKEEVKALTDEIEEIKAEYKTKMAEAQNIEIDLKETISKLNKANFEEKDKRMRLEAEIIDNK